jgi:hypothetical protein
MERMMSESSKFEMELKLFEKRRDEKRQVFEAQMAALEEEGKRLKAPDANNIAMKCTFDKIDNRNS